MEYRYEIHCHTKNTSRCGKTDAKELVKQYREAGYDGLVITDHYSPMTFDAPDFFSHSRMISHYLRGYRAAKECETEDFTVLLGMELRFYATVNDYLVYGVTEELLSRLPNLMPLYVRRASKLLQKNGCVFLQAHPFRDFITRANPKYLDGCEILNGKTAKPRNDAAREWAEENGMKIRIGGSDCHSLKQLGTSGIITKERIRTQADLLRILRTGAFTIITPPEAPDSANPDNSPVAL